MAKPWQCQQAWHSPWLMADATIGSTALGRAVGSADVDILDVHEPRAPLILLLQRCGCFTFVGNRESDEFNVAYAWGGGCNPCQYLCREVSASQLKLEMKFQDVEEGKGTEIPLGEDGPAGTGALSRVGHQVTQKKAI